MAKKKATDAEPNGRRFREWVGVRDRDEERWMSLLNESIEFVRPPRP